MNFFFVVVAFEDEPARFFFLGMVIPFLSEGDGELCISDCKVDLYRAGLAHSEAGVWNYFQEEHQDLRKLDSIWSVLRSVSKLSTACMHERSSSLAASLWELLNQMLIANRPISQ